jgi:hypothetical protein
MVGEMRENRRGFGGMRDCRFGESQVDRKERVRGGEGGKERKEMIRYFFQLYFGLWWWWLLFYPWGITPSYQYLDMCIDN